MKENTLETGFYCRQQSVRLDTQAIGQSKNRVQRRLTNTTLQHRDIGWVQIALEREGFLRQPQFLSTRSNLIAKRLRPFIPYFLLRHGFQRDPKRTFRLTDYSLWIIQTIVCVTLLSTRS